MTIGLEMTSALLRGEKFDFVAREKADATKPKTRASVVAEMEAAIAMFVYPGGEVAQAAADRMDRSPGGALRQARLQLPQRRYRPADQPQDRLAVVSRLQLRSGKSFLLRARSRAWRALSRSGAYERPDRTLCTRCGLKIRGRVRRSATCESRCHLSGRSGGSCSGRPSCGPSRPRLRIDPACAPRGG